MRQYLKVRPKKAIDVLNNLYTKNKSKSCNPTYKNKQTTEVYIESNKYRTIDSLYQIAKGYFSNLKYDNFVNQIIKSKKYYFIGCWDTKNVTIGRAVYNIPNGLAGESIPKLEQFAEKYLNITDE